jgi:hypothetical protein
MDIVVVIGTVASVIAALSGVILLFVQLRSPYFSCFKVNSFGQNRFVVECSLATSLIGCRFLKASVNGAFIKQVPLDWRSHFSMPDASGCSKSVSLNFVTDPQSLVGKFAFLVFPPPNSETFPASPELEISWKWFFIHRSLTHPFNHSNSALTS